jgi:multicomponent K+:H+ antiporter subunit E
VKRWLPHPFLTAALWLAWLILQQSLAPGTLIIGAVLAWAIAKLWARLEPPRVNMRHVGKLVLLAIRVGIDIVLSNWAVARLIVTGRRHVSRFVAIDLDVRQRPALALLATIITATPGTIWVSHDSRRHRLIIHVLDGAAAEQLVANIKQRYEPALREVFG